MLPLRRRAWPLLLCCALTLVACGGPAPAARAPQVHVISGTATSQQSNLGAQVDPGANLGRTPAPGFRLTGQSGRSHRLSDFRGHVVLLAFVDSRSTTDGLLTAQMLRDAKQLLGTAGAGVQLLAVNANPDATSVQDVRSWSNRNGMSGRWLFLTGTPAQLRHIWKLYHISVEVAPGSGKVTHTDATYVIDAAGRERYLFLTDPNFSGTAPEAHDLARRVASLLPGGASVAPVSTLAGTRATAGALPKAGPFTLPGVGGTAVRVGQGRPRLVAFFATWCHACRQDLQNLDRYAQQARSSGSGLPGVVAVDLRVAEPSNAWVTRFVRQQHVSFPVALDTTGRVSDAYGVTALPYLAAVSGSGRILWRHVGALPTAALEGDVRAALAKAH